MNYTSVCAAICLTAVSSYAAGPAPRAVKTIPRTAESAARPPKAPRTNRDARALGGQELSRVPTLPSDKQENAPEKDRAWTNERLQHLHERGLISEFNRLPEARAEATLEIAAEENNPFRVYDRTQDARWYAEQVAALNAKIQALETELVRYQAELRYVRDLRTTEAGLAVYQDTVGITPEAGIEVRKALLENLRGELEDIRDLARRNNIPPGIVRD